MKITALANWFGTNRTLAHHVGAMLDGCRWVGIPFAGGMCEVPHIKASTIAVNDLHKHIINLARVTAHPVLGPMLYRRLRREIFHPGRLDEAQAYCVGHQPNGQPDIEAAHEYFVSSWMARAGWSGTEKEFDATFCRRWGYKGGGSQVRWANAAAALPSWRKALARCQFDSMDAVEFLSRCRDEDKIGIYCDPPFPGPGDKYAHKIDQKALRDAVERFNVARVVMRFYDHPMVRELYGADRWTWNIMEGGKTQANNAAPEVLLVNNPGPANT